jgi:diguanylate cyclase (GGDEF)-like protein
MRNANSSVSRWSWLLSLALWVAVTAAVIATAVLTERSLSRLADARDVHTHAVLVDEALKGMMSQMVDAETGQRGFLLTGRATYLQPYYAALAQLRESRAALAVALNQEPSAVGQLDVLDKAVAAKLQELDRTVRLKSEGRSDEAVALVLTDTGTQTMDAVREALRALATDQGRRTDQQQTANEQKIRNNYWIFGVALSLSVLLLVALVQRVRYVGAQAKARNNELSRLLEAAAARNEQVQRLSELTRFLQSCADMDEAVRLLQQQLPLLMRAATGALYLMAASRNQLRQAFAWGGGEPYVEYFEPSDCWAVRLGQPFRQPAQTGAASCAHLQSEHPRVHDNIQCLPLVALGELMGLLVLDIGIKGEQRVDAENEGYRRIALEQVGLSLGSLKLRESLRQQSIRDVLTGLYNRRFLEESAQREVLRALRLQAQGGHNGLALLMIDIDHFKNFNDLHGHEVGDQVLREVAQVLQRQTRGSDVAARYGGEEFTVVLVDIPAELALERAEKVRADVEKLVLHPSGKVVGTVTISIGLAQFPTHGSTVEELLLAADKALYEAKHAGRNRVVVAS